MRWKTLCALAVSVCPFAAIPVAYAQSPGPLDVYFANTLIAEKDGDEIAVYFGADGRFGTSIGNGGVWSINGEIVCLDYDTAVDLCVSGLLGRQIGDQWQTADADGLPLNMRLIEGR